jgi:hypothetical protein
MTSGHCHNRFSLKWEYGVKERDDCIEVKVIVHQNNKDNKEEERNQDQGSGRQAPPYDPLCERRGCGGTTFPQDQNEKDATTIETIETMTKTKTKTVQLRRWSTFKCHNFPDGAIVVGFRGRRDYKDGVCQGIMCSAWSTKQNHFIPFTYTISNGYNSKFSVTDFETLELCDKEEFTLKNSDAVKSIKKQMR